MVSGCNLRRKSIFNISWCKLFVIWSVWSDYIIDIWNWCCTKWRCRKRVGWIMRLIFDQRIFLIIQSNWLYNISLFLFQQVSIQFHYWALTTFELDPGKKLAERRWRRLLPPGSCMKLEFDVTDWARPPGVLAFFSFALIFVYLIYIYMIRISSAQPSA